MKKIFLSSFALLVFLSAFSQSTRKLSSFTGVSAQEGIDVILKKGSAESAVVNASGIDDDEVLTDVEGNTLRIHLEGNNHHHVEVTVTVTYVSLSSLKASSSASIVVKDAISTKGDFEVSCSSSGDVKATIQADELDVSASSSGDVDLEVDVVRIDADLSSSGDLTISGNAKKARIEVSSSGEFDGYDFICDDVDLRASSGGTIKIAVNNEIEARASSGASIRYKGSPKITDVSSSSGGSVKRY